MKQLVKNAIKSVKSVSGNSLAEFATTTALMATLAATAAPKLSELSEGTKAEKSRNEIDKIVKIAGNFYQETADGEGRGRFPNQKKFNVAIGGGGEVGVNYSNGSSNGAVYSLGVDQSQSNKHMDLIMEDLGFGTGDGWDRYDETHSNTWQSVFGMDSSDVSALQSNGVTQPINYNAQTAAGIGTADGLALYNEWDPLFGDDELQSKFQDGHYVYTVIAGGGTGDDAYPPMIFVADVESAVDFHNVLAP